MIEENISQEFSLKTIDETEQNELLSGRHKKVCTTF